MALRIEWIEFKKALLPDDRFLVSPDPTEVLDIIEMGPMTIGIQL